MLRFFKFMCLYTRAAYATTLFPSKQTTDGVKGVDIDLLDKKFLSFKTLFRTDTN
jgi:hypothetical protein